MSAPTWELRAGRWENVLADVTAVDALITDPPYSARTHEGQRTGNETRKSTINYAPLERADVEKFVRHWVPRVQQWFVVFGDHETAHWWHAELDVEGMYVFAPVPWNRTDPTPRQNADGPAQGVEWIVVARPPRLPVIRLSRPPEYRGPSASTRGNAKKRSGSGQKPEWLMRHLVRDYSAPGDLVVDSFSGWGTTGAAAVSMGRRFIGSEMDKGRHALAHERIAQAAAQAPLFVVPETQAKPIPLFDRSTMRATRGRRGAA